LGEQTAQTCDISDLGLGLRKQEYVEIGQMAQGKDLAAIIFVVCSLT
jgi:hypothetical protein